MENPGSKSLMKLKRVDVGKLYLTSAHLMNIYFYGQRFEDYLFLLGIPSPRNLGLPKLCFPHFSTNLETIYIGNKYNKPRKA